MVNPLRVVIGISLLGAASISTAQEEVPWERYSINFGAFFADSDTELRFDSDDLGVGTTIDPKATLGMDTEDLSYRLDAFWRFGSTRRHQLEVHYFNVDNQGSRTLDLGTRIGNVLFPRRAHTVGSRHWDTYHRLGFQCRCAASGSGRLGNLHSTGAGARLARRLCYHIPLAFQSLDRPGVPTA